MKTNHIIIIVGVIILLLIIANWNKIFKTEKKRIGGTLERKNVTQDMWTFNQIDSATLYGYPNSYVFTGTNDLPLSLRGKIPIKITATYSNGISTPYMNFNIISIPSLKKVIINAKFPVPVNATFVSGTLQRA